MRLLNIDTWKLESYANVDFAPAYVILSHRWRKDEVAFEDFEEHPFMEQNQKLEIRIQNLERLIAAIGTEHSLSRDDKIENIQQDTPRHPIVEQFPHLHRVCRRAAWSKLEGLAKIAKTLGFSHVWVDTFCIDQKSSSELSESINSMFQWYSMSQLCVTYLYDINASNPDLTKSEWFERGWTLQELIAPQDLWFYSGDWTFLYTRKEAAEHISASTKIPVKICRGATDSSLAGFSVAARISWASNRKTTKPEDRAYSLMGLFGINITTIYGEGEVRAFFRLQTEIFQAIPDQSIFCWGSFESPKFPPWASTGTAGLFAPYIEAFSPCGEVVAQTMSWTEHLPVEYIPSTAFNTQIHRDRVQFLARIVSAANNRQYYEVLLCCTMKSKHIAIEVLTTQTGRSFRWSYQIRQNKRLEKGCLVSNWQVMDFYIPYVTAPLRKKMAFPHLRSWAPITKLVFKYSALVQNGFVLSVKSQSGYSVDEEQNCVIYDVGSDQLKWDTSIQISASHSPILRLDLEIQKEMMAYFRITVHGRLIEHAPDETCNATDEERRLVSPAVSGTIHLFAQTARIFSIRAQGRLFFLSIRDGYAGQLTLGVI